MYRANSGAIISSNALKVCRADTRRKNFNEKVHRQYANLVREFDDFVKNKAIYLYKAKELTPIELLSPREILLRDTKDSIAYIGLGSTTDEPRNRKKVGKKKNLQI